MRTRSGGSVSQRSALSSRCAFKAAVQSLRGGGKGGIKRIAAGFEEVTVVLLNRLTQNFIMPRQGRAHGIGLLLPEAGAGLDVGKKKSHGSGRRCG